MATRAVDHLLIGGGIASASCAAELRALGADGSILVVGREADPPYHRPPLSKGYLRGEESRTEALVHPGGWWAEHDVDLALGTSVVAIDLHARSVQLSSGDEVRFDQALLATGAAHRPVALDGVHYLRTLADADALHGSLADAEHVVVYGGSYLACEVAASLTTGGRRCTIVMREAYPFETAFGETAGRFLHGVLTAHGITLVTEDAPDRVLPGHVRTVRGMRLNADVVVVGAGAEPASALARHAGLQLGPTGGVRCDASLRTAHPTLLCAGDVCEYDSVVHGRPVRIEHEHAAVEQGRTAARNMLGERRVHDAVPYSWCDLADYASLEYVGSAGRWDDEVVRGSVDGGEFSLWYLRNGQVVGALLVSRPADLDPACGLIASRAVVTDRRHLLTDPSADLSAVSM